MNRLMNGQKVLLLIEPCYMTKAERMREKVCNFLAPENEILCQKVADMSKIVRLGLRLDLQPAPVVVTTKLLVPPNHYYCLVSVCDNASRRQKKTNLLRASTTCILEIDAWPQQLQDKTTTRSKSI